MVKRMLVLCIMALMVFGTAQANMLVNGTFEAGTVDGTAMDVNPEPGWSFYGWNTAALWQVDDPAKGNQAVKVTRHTYEINIEQYLDATAGETYYCSIDVLNPSSDPLYGYDGRLYMQFFDSAGGYLDGGEYIFDPTTEAQDTWVTIGGTLTAPVNTATVRYVYTNYWLGSPEGGSLIIDNAGLCVGTPCEFFTGQATDPWPENGSPQVPGDVNARGLEFTLPDHATFTSVDYDVYFQADDPNMSSVTPVSGSGDPNERIFIAVPETITTGHTYHWRVDVDVAAEPNDLAGFYLGVPWSFTTTNAPPTVDTGEPITQNVWLSAGSAVVSLDGVITDDDLPDPPGAVTTLWSSSPDTGVSFVDDSNSVTDVTFTIAGDYFLTLTADDGDFVVSSDPIQIRVLDEGNDGLVALYEFEGTANDTAPIGGNHHGVLSTTNTEDLTLPVIDTLDAKVGNGSMLLTVLGQRVYVPDSGVADPNWIDGSNISATWADMQDTDQVTLSAWIKVAPGEFAAPWISMLRNGDAYGIYRNSSTSNGFFNMTDLLSDPPYQEWTFDDAPITVTLDDNTWHHIAGTFDGTALRLYVDGVLEGEFIGDTYYLNSMPLGGGYLQIGDGLHGRIDQVRIHDVALSDAMIMAQFVSDGGSNSCRQQYDPMDLNQDCYTDIADFAVFAASWLNCNDQSNPTCTP